MTSSALPPVDRAAIPADVKTADERRTYDAALGFERLLVEQLAQSLAQSAPAGGADGADGDAAGQAGMAGPYSQLLPGALADAVTQSGGLGLARQLYDAMRTDGAA